MVVVWAGVEVVARTVAAVMVDGVEGLVAVRV